VAKVAIECDGKHYHTDKSKDQARDRQLESLGWIVYRIDGADCIKDSDEEMGESPASVFVRNIVEIHGVKR
jgi:very-short-patch-repair endonuclease